MNASSGPVAQAVNTITNAANAAVTNTANAFKNVATTVTNAANKAVNQAAPAINSLIPFGTPNNKKNNAAAAMNAAANNRKNNGGIFGAVNNAVNAVANIASPPPTAANMSVTPIDRPWLWPLIIFGVLVVIFITIFALFSEQIKAGYETVAASFKQSMGLSTQPPVQAQVVPMEGEVAPVTEPPKPPQDVLPDEAQQRQNLVERILPTGAGNEVFNVSQNKFTFYDAEPLCRALGAELATYEQVKDAWGKGADWCNYGWVKGQMAVYPTQQETYEKLQAGPEDERSACGSVGINGGFFDNPELRYGVNCYGKKPPQSAHDEKKLMEQGKIPRSPAALTVDKLVQEFRSKKDALFVRPFNDGKWSAS
jgi:hypothetical protein